MITDARIQKEFQTITKQNEFQVWLINNDYRHWKAIVKGPDDSVYQGGKFQIDIKIPDKYPYIPPKMFFDTKLWHPNVSSVTGAICLDILKDEWSPALSIRTALLSIQSLMWTPEPDNPQDAVVAKQYKENKEEFDKTARKWTAEHADPDKLKKQKIIKITDMGFSEKQAIEALEKVGWDENEAIQYLVN